jgi:hypothetical protein
MFRAAEETFWFPLDMNSLPKSTKEEDGYSVAFEDQHWKGKHESGKVSTLRHTMKVTRIVSWYWLKGPSVWVGA